MRTLFGDLCLPASVVIAYAGRITNSTLVLALAILLFAAAGPARFRPPPSLATLPLPARNSA